MPNTTIEIIGGRDRRRRWSLEEKLRVVAETHEPGARVRDVAARHDVYPSLLHTWRRLVREGHLASTAPACFVPVSLAEPVPVIGAAPAPVTARATAELIEIELPDGSRVRVGNDVNLTALRRVMAVLRG